MTMDEDDSRVSEELYKCYICADIFNRDEWCKGHERCNWCCPKDCPSYQVWEEPSWSAQDRNPGLTGGGE